LAAFLNESLSSGSDYEEEEGMEDSDEIQSDGELEDDEPDTTTKIKEGKKRKKGHIARDQVSAAVAAISDGPSPFVTAKGRVGTNQTQTPG
jgi:hypothetical protein